MIYKNNKTISEWYFNDAELIKVYKNGAICYYKIVHGGTPSQEPCFAVVEDITQYSDTEFVDVYDKATEKWYKLNNLDQYEEYGVYGSGRTITYYEGKLTIDNGYEYEWDGSEWDNLGEITGSTATLPDVAFTINYNAKEYDANTKTLPKTLGQLAGMDAVITAGTPTVGNGYLTIAQNTRATITGYQEYFNRDGNNPTLTIIAKVYPSDSSTLNNCHLFANRGGNNYNWMFRTYKTKLTLHGNSEQGQIAITDRPAIVSVRIDSNSLATYNNWTDQTSSTYSSYSYGNTNSSGTALFAGYYDTSSEWFIGDFYWIYMSQNTLTDEQVQQVINYNEGDVISEYPKYYTTKDEPENNVVFEDMEEALAYECPWVGMDVTIDNTPYLFGDAYEWLTKYGLFEVSGGYMCYNGDKYEKMEEMVRNTDGTWEHQIPIVYERGDLIEAGSTDCQTIDYSTEYLTFVAETDNVSFQLVGGVNGNTFQYSTDSGSTWNNVSIGQTTSSINTGDKIMFKASSLSVGNETGIGTIRPTASASVEGNIMSLAYGDNFTGQTVIPNNFQFRKLFSGATNITSAENMVFPATTIKKQCYSQMFQGCTSMVTAPKKVGEASMTWSGDYCWSDMFHGCTSLINAPQLPATNLGTQCYWYMFEDCTSLTTAPELPALTINTQSYCGMFYGCTRLNSITCLATAGISTNNCNLWVTNVSSSGTFTKAANASWGRGTSAAPSNWTIVNYSG